MPTASRTDAERPFPFLESIDPLTYAYDYLAEVDLPKVVYRSVAGLTADGLTARRNRRGMTGARGSGISG